MRAATAAPPAQTAFGLPPVQPAAVPMVPRPVTSVAELVVTVRPMAFHALSSFARQLPAASAVATYDAPRIAAKASLLNIL